MSVSVIRGKINKALSWNGHPIRNSMMTIKCPHCGAEQAIDFMDEGLPHEIFPSFNSAYFEAHKILVDWFAKHLQNCGG